MKTTTKNKKTPGAIAQSLTGRDYVSHTQISTFQRCPLRWHFQYVERCAPESVSVGLAIGRSIHAALEHHFRSLREGNGRPSLVELLEVFHASWEDHAAVPILFGRDTDRQDVDRIARTLLQAVGQHPAASVEGRMLGVEEPLRGRIVAGVPDLLARADLIVETGDGLLIRDFKTSRSRWTESKCQSSAPQLLLYGALAEVRFGAVANGRLRLEFVVLTKTRVPSVDTHVVEPDPVQWARTKRVIARVWSAMIASHIYPNPTPLNCTTCPFHRRCKRWSG